VRQNVHSDLDDLQNDNHLSYDGKEYVLPVIRRAVGTVQMVTALLITTVSGGFRLYQSAGADLLAIVGNLALITAGILLFGYLYASDPYTYSAGIDIPLLPIRIQRAPVFVIGLNAFYFISICLS